MTLLYQKLIHISIQNNSKESKETAQPGPVNTGTRGRPTLMTPELTEQIAMRLAVGNFLTTACAACGVKYDTVLRWLERGRKADPDDPEEREFIHFLHTITRAEAEGESACVVAIRGAAKEQWQAAAWLLSHRHPDRWADTVRYKRELEAMTDEQLNAEAARLFGGNPPTEPTREPDSSDSR
jgi:hypothetical protein